MQSSEFQDLIRNNEKYYEKFKNDPWFNKAIMALIANKKYDGEITVEDMLDMMCRLLEVMNSN